MRLPPLFFAAITLLAGCRKDPSGKAGQTTPVIQELSPATDGPGALVSIRGSGFGTTLSALTVDFNGQAASLVSANDTLIRVTVPGQATTGKVHVTLNGKQVTSTMDFVVLSGVWTRMADLPAYGRASVVAFTLKGLAYIVSGYNGGGTFQDMYAYDPGSNTWTRKADPPFPGYYRSVGISTATKGYLIGGAVVGSPRTKDLWEYDPDLDQWTRKADFPGSARYSGAGFSIQGKVYFGTGNDGSDLNDWWEYDPGTDTWTRKADFPGAPRSYAMALGFDDHGYLGLGAFYSPTGNDWWKYDPVQDQWSRQADYPGPVQTAYSGCFRIGSKAYISGGQYQACWEFDTQSGHWTQKTSHPTTRLEGIGFALGNTGYLCLGTTEQVFLDRDCWSFNPGQ
ncbi:MAG TPA: kelch repeat-containing protein [Chitinophagaceae bacterium]|nr:kelch repeat-containing protein [Chitinophagaceae bacterium]